MKIELWADSFHEGNWCVENLAEIAKKNGYVINRTYQNGFIPRFSFSNSLGTIELVVYGSYNSWNPVPEKISNLLEWGKPDFIAYSSEKNEILFAVEETAATPTGNQALQRCERQYGSARLQIPYWYLISEYGVHGDGGVRRDSIWPSISAIKLSMIKKTPCIVLHYSDIDNPENYNSGKGMELLFNSLFLILENYNFREEDNNNLLPLLSEQYDEMISFVKNQWSNIIDFLPSESIINSKGLGKEIARLSFKNNEKNKSSKLKNLFVWPRTDELPENILDQLEGKPLLKYDELANLLENDLSDKKAYNLSNNSGSGRPPLTSQIDSWIDEQRRIFNNSKFKPDKAKFNLKLDDFPDTGTNSNRRHLTTAKNIVYLYDYWEDFDKALVQAFPRLNGLLPVNDRKSPVFVYLSNSLKPGRIFGDPFTGQISAYSTTFGRFDNPQRLVVAYFPHQSFGQIDFSSGRRNKGLTIMEELTDYLIFHEGVAVDLKNRKII
tara:strand:+ start:134 stop:1618 length:1485 start_codon:yes stop_codon:yes gene_type:complete